MKIILQKIKDGWRADCLDLPGTPPCGDGKTKEMAIVALFFQILSVPSWIKYLKLEEPIYINAEMWEYPDWMKK